EGKSGELIAAAFCEEIGAPQLAPPSCPRMGTTFGAVAAALEGELLLPLRALQEGTESMTRTFLGAPVPRRPIEQKVAELTAAVLEGGFARWRYEKPGGQGAAARPLRGAGREVARAHGDASANAPGARGRTWRVGPLLGHQDRRPQPRL
ncbi:unnamed protein product, partial [Prorocentrum cordatum]